MRNIRVALLGILTLSCLMCVPAGAAELKLAVGLSLPPYVISDNDTGMEMDIVRQALAYKGHQFRPVYVPFGQVAKSLQAGEVDGALTVNEQMGLSGVFFSASHITYRNVAITLQARGLTINSVQDLAGKRVVAFQDAPEILGAAFAAAVRGNPAYQEVPEQRQQVQLLFTGGTDVVVSDINIFTYYRRQTSDVDTTAPVAIHNLFAPTRYHVGFLDARRRDDFNAGLQALRASGQYEAIIRKYLPQ